jgi:hypothetical protein
MSEIVKGVLGGGWALLVGWLVPTAVNVLLVVMIVPQLGGSPSTVELLSADGSRHAVLALAVAVLAGLVLAAIQTPLYRILEGYLAWPSWLFAAGQRRMLRDKHLLADRLQAAELLDAERDGTLDQAGERALAAMRAHPVVGRYLARDANRSAVQRGLMHERLRRFPASDDQVVATRLGNSIRRLEEYGYDRFRLDSQVFWYELTAVAPESATKQVDQARTSVDFFVALLWGHLFVAAGVAVAYATGAADDWWPAAAAGALVLLTFIWYRVALAVSDDWAAAVRGMVNVARRPLAEAMGLVVPKDLAAERDMWTYASRLTRLPYDERATVLDRFRAGTEQAPDA